MRILMIAENYLPHQGGSRVYYHRLLGDVRGHSVHVLTREHPESAAFDAQSGYAITRIPLQESRWLRPLRLQEWPIYRRLYRAACALQESDRFDAILCDMPAPCGVVGSWLRKRYGTPYVIVSHDEPLQVGRRFLPKLERRVLCEADHVISSSHWARSKVLDIGVAADRTTVIPPALEAAQFLPSPQADEWRQRHGLSGKTVLLTVSRLEYHKGHAQVIGVLPEILRGHPEVRYVVIGTGREGESLQVMARDAGVWEQVLFLGAVSDAERLAALSACDVFVLAARPTRDGRCLEGFGIVLIEASAVGKPVISGAIGGTGDAVRHGETGFWIDATEPETLRGAILQLIENKELALKMGAAGQAFARAGFMLPGCGDQLIRLLGEVARARQS